MFEYLVLEWCGLVRGGMALLWEALVEKIMWPFREGVGLLGEVWPS